MLQYVPISVVHISRKSQTGEPGENPRLSAECRRTLPTCDQMFDAGLEPITSVVGGRRLSYVLHAAINRADFVSWWMWFNGSTTKAQRHHRIDTQPEVRLRVVAFDVGVLVFSAAAIFLASVHGKCLRYTENGDVVFTKKNSSLFTLERGRWIRILCDSSNLHKQKLVKPKLLASKMAAVKKVGQKNGEVGLLVEYLFCDVIFSPMHFVIFLRI